MSLRINRRNNFLEIKEGSNLKIFKDTPRYLKKDIPDHAFPYHLDYCNNKHYGLFYEPSFHINSESEMMTSAALKFEGSEFLETNEISLTGKNEFSISSWIKTDSSQDEILITDVDSQASGCFIVKSNNSNNRPEFSVYNGVNGFVSVTGQSAINDGDWHLINVNFNTDKTTNSFNIEIYIDSELQDSKNISEVKDSTILESRSLIDSKFNTLDNNIYNIDDHNHDTYIEFGGDTQETDILFPHQITDGIDKIRMRAIPDSSSFFSEDSLISYSLLLKNKDTGEISTREFQNFGIGDWNEDRGITINSSSTLYQTPYPHAIPEKGIKYGPPESFFTVDCPNNCTDINNASRTWFPIQEYNLVTPNPYILSIPVRKLSRVLYAGSPATTYQRGGTITIKSHLINAQTQVSMIFSSSSVPASFNLDTTSNLLTISYPRHSTPYGYFGTDPFVGSVLSFINSQPDFYATTDASTSFQGGGTPGIIAGTYTATTVGSNFAIPQSSYPLRSTDARDYEEDAEGNIIENSSKYVYANFNTPQSEAPFLYGQDFSVSEFDGFNIIGIRYKHTGGNVSFSRLIQLSLFKDNIEKDILSFSPFPNYFGAQSNTESSRPITIGSSSLDNKTNFFKGSIDQLILSNKNISQERINSFFAGEQTKSYNSSIAKELDVISWYDFADIDTIGWDRHYKKSTKEVVRLYTFNNTRKDSSAYAITPEEFGSISYSDSILKFDSYSAYFDGSSYLFDPGGRELSFQSNFTFDCFLNFSTIPEGSEQHIIQTKNLGSTGVSFKYYFQNKKIKLVIFTGISKVIEIESEQLDISTNQFYHVALCRNREKIYMFFNRSFCGEASLPFYLSLNDSEEGMYLLNNFHGHIQDLRIIQESSLYNPNSTIDKFDKRLGSDFYERNTLETTSHFPLPEKSTFDESRGIFIPQGHYLKNSYSHKAFNFHKNSFSIVSWIRLENLNKNGYILGSWNDEGGHSHCYALRYVKNFRNQINTLVFLISEDGTNFRNVKTLKLKNNIIVSKTWYFVSVSYNSQSKDLNMQLYDKFDLIDSDTISVNQIFSNRRRDDFQINGVKHTESSNTFLDFSISQLFFLNKAISTAETQTFWKSGAGVTYNESIENHLDPTSDIIAWFDFSEGSTQDLNGTNHLTSSTSFTITEGRTKFESIGDDAEIYFGKTSAGNKHFSNLVGNRPTFDFQGINNLPSISFNQSNKSFLDTNFELDFTDSFTLYFCFESKGSNDEFSPILDFSNSATEGLSLLWKDTPNKDNFGEFKLIANEHEIVFSNESFLRKINAVIVEWDRSKEKIFLTINNSRLSDAERCLSQTGIHTNFTKTPLSLGKFYYDQLNELGNFNGFISEIIYHNNKPNFNVLEYFACKYDTPTVGEPPDYLRDDDNPSILFDTSQFRQTIQEGTTSLGQLLCSLENPIYSIVGSDDFTINEDGFIYLESPALRSEDFYTVKILTEDADSDRSATINLISYVQIDYIIANINTSNLINIVSNAQTEIGLEIGCVTAPEEVIWSTTSENISIDANGCITLSQKPLDGDTLIDFTITAEDFQGNLTSTTHSIEIIDVLEGATEIEFTPRAYEDVHLSIVVPEDGEYLELNLDGSYKLYEISHEGFSKAKQQNSSLNNATLYASHSTSNSTLRSSYSVPTHPALAKYSNPLDGFTTTDLNKNTLTYDTQLDPGQPKYFDEDLMYLSQSQIENLPFSGQSISEIISENQNLIIDNLSGIHEQIIDNPNSGEADFYSNFSGAPTGQGYWENADGGFKTYAQSLSDAISLHSSGNVYTNASNSITNLESKTVFISTNSPDTNSISPNLEDIKSSDLYDVNNKYTDFGVTAALKVIDNLTFKIENNNPQQIKRINLSFKSNSTVKIRGKFIHIGNMVRNPASNLTSNVSITSTQNSYLQSLNFSNSRFNRLTLNCTTDQLINLDHFLEGSTINEISKTNFNTKNVISFNYGFYSNYEVNNSIKSFLSSLSFENLISAKDLFHRSHLKGDTILNLSNWNSWNLQLISRMFKSCIIEYNCVAFCSSTASVINNIDGFRYGSSIDNIDPDSALPIESWITVWEVNTNSTFYTSKIKEATQCFAYSLVINTSLSEAFHGSGALNHPGQLQDYYYIHNANDYHISLTRTDKTIADDFGNDPYPGIRYSLLGNNGEEIDYNSDFFQNTQVNVNDYQQNQTLISVNSGGMQGTKLDLSCFFLDRCTNASQMFIECAVQEIDLTNFKFSLITDFSFFFYGCTYTQKIILTSIRSSGHPFHNSLYNCKAYDISHMFENCYSLRDLSHSYPDVESSNPSDFLERMELISQNDQYKHEDAMTHINFENCILAKETFKNCYSLKYLSAPVFNKTLISLQGFLHNATNLRFFRGFQRHSEYNINVVSSYLNEYYYAIDILRDGDDEPSFLDATFYFPEEWDLHWSYCNTTNLLDVTRMFSNCKRLLQLDLSGLSVHNVQQFTETFDHCHSLFNLNIGNQATQLVRLLESNSPWYSNTGEKFSIFYYGFYGDNPFPSFPVGLFSTSKAWNFNSMFRKCYQISHSINSKLFDFSNAKELENAFEFVFVNHFYNFLSNWQSHFSSLDSFDDVLSSGGQTLLNSVLTKIGYTPTDPNNLTLEDKFLISLGLSDEEAADFLTHAKQRDINESLGSLTVYEEGSDWTVDDSQSQVSDYTNHSNFYGITTQNANIAISTDGSVVAYTMDWHQSGGYGYRKGNLYVFRKKDDGTFDPNPYNSPNAQIYPSQAEYGGLDGSTSRQWDRLLLSADGNTLIYGGKNVSRMKSPTSFGGAFVTYSWNESSSSWSLVETSSGNPSGAEGFGANDRMCTDFALNNAGDVIVCGAVPYNNRNSSYASIFKFNSSNSEWEPMEIYHTTFVDKAVLDVRTISGQAGGTVTVDVYDSAYSGYSNLKLNWTHPRDGTTGTISTDDPNDTLLINYPQVGAEARFVVTIRSITINKWYGNKRIQNGGTMTVTSTNPNVNYNTEFIISFVSSGTAASFVFDTTANTITLQYPRYSTNQGYLAWTSTGGRDFVSYGTDPSVVDIVAYINNQSGFSATHNATSQYEGVESPGIVQGTYTATTTLSYPNVSAVINFINSQSDFTAEASSTVTLDAPGLETSTGNPAHQTVSMTQTQNPLYKISPSQPIGNISPEFMPGDSVDINGDGNVIVIGNYLSKYARSYILNETTNQWEQRGSDIPTTTSNEANAALDSKLKISQDGNTIAISSPNTDIITSPAQIGQNISNPTYGNIGMVKIFKWSESASDWVDTTPNLLSGLPMIMGKTTSSFCGQSLSLSSDGNKVFVSEAYLSSTGSPAYKIIYEYNSQNNEWIQSGRIFPNPDTLQGSPYGFSGNTRLTPDNKLLLTTSATSSPTTASFIIDLEKAAEYQSVSDSLNYTIDTTDYSFTDSETFFLNFSNRTTNEALNLTAIFNQCYLLKNIHIEGENIKVGYDFNFVFENCASLRRINLSKLDFSETSNFSYTFSGCTHLFTLTLNNTIFANNNNIYDISAMFQNCLSLKQLDTSQWYGSEVTNMSNMFENCLSLQELDLSSFNPNKCTNFSSLFKMCISLNSLNLSNFNTQSSESFSEMFQDVSAGFFISEDSINNNANLLRAQNCVFFSDTLTAYTFKNYVNLINTLSYSTFLYTPLGSALGPLTSTNLRQELSTTTLRSEFIDFLVRSDQTSELDPLILTSDEINSAQNTITSTTGLSSLDLSSFSLENIYGAMNYQDARYVWGQPINSTQNGTRIRNTSDYDNNIGFILETDSQDLVIGFKSDFKHSRADAIIAEQASNYDKFLSWKDFHPLIDIHGSLYRMFAGLVVDELTIPSTFNLNHINQDFFILNYNYGYGSTAIGALNPSEIEQGEVVIFGGAPKLNNMFEYLRCDKLNISNEFLMSTKRCLSFFQFFANAKSKSIKLVGSSAEMTKATRSFHYADPGMGAIIDTSGTDFTKLDFSSGTNLGYVFANASMDINTSKFDFSNALDFERAFQNFDISRNDLIIYSWNTQNVLDFSLAFSNLRAYSNDTASFKQADLSGLSIKSARILNGLFSNADLSAIILPNNNLLFPDQNSNQFTNLASLFSSGGNQTANSFQHQNKLQPIIDSLNDFISKLARSGTANVISFNMFLADFAGDHNIYYGSETYNPNTVGTNDYTSTPNNNSVFSDYNTATLELDFSNINFDYAENLAYLFHDTYHIKNFNNLVINFDRRNHPGSISTYSLREMFFYIHPSIALDFSNWCVDSLTSYNFYGAKSPNGLGSHSGTSINSSFIEPPWGQPCQ